MNEGEGAKEGEVVGVEETKQVPIVDGYEKESIEANGAEAIEPEEPKLNERVGDVVNEEGAVETKDKVERGK
jgi:hypothetical protein